MAFVI